MKASLPFPWLVCIAAASTIFVGHLRAQTEADVPVFTSVVAEDEPRPQPDEVVASSEATVTLPYAELKQLWESAHLLESEKKAAETTADPKPPVTAILHSAAYQLEFSGRDLLLRVDCRAENLDDEWQRLPLLGGDFSLTESIPADALVVRNEGVYELLLPPKSAADLQLSLATPAALPANWWVEHPLPRFQPAPASVRTLSRVNMPDDVQLAIAGVEWRLGNRNQGDESLRVLPPDDKPLDWLLTKANADSPTGGTTEDMVPTPVAWQLRSELFAAFDDGKLGFELRIHARTDAENGGRLLHLLLPAGARGITAQGEGLVRHREIPREKPVDPRRVELLWSDTDRAEREFTVAFELAQSPLVNQWKLPLPVSDPPAESAALAVIGVNEGLEISGDNVRPASASAGLPRWLVEATDGSDFVSLDLDASRTVDIRWLPRVNTAPAVVAEAHAVTRIVADGALLNHAEFHIDHDAPLNWTVSLPVDSELLTAFVNGVAARPIQRDATTLEVQLPTPPRLNSKSDNTQSVVRLTYAGKVDAFDPVSGSVALELPETPLFVHRLQWDVHIPERYETSAIDGNIAIDTDREPCPVGEEHTQKSDDSRAIQLRKELIRNEAPQVEIFYRSNLTGS